jgi:hypothetical protein
MRSRVKRLWRSERDCQRRNRSWFRQSVYAEKFPPKKCANPKCGHFFLPKRSDAKTCSVKCRVALSRAGRSVTSERFVADERARRTKGQNPLSPQSGISKRTLFPKSRHANSDAMGHLRTYAVQRLTIMCSPLMRDDDTGNVLTDDRITFARAFFDALAIQYFYFAARVFDQARFLQRVRAQRHRRPLHSKHVR